MNYFQNWTFSTFSCGGRESVLPVAETYIMVNPAPVPSITIDGPTVMTPDVPTLHAGIKLFEHVHIGIDYALDPQESSTIKSSKSAKLKKKMARLNAQRMLFVHIRIIYRNKQRYTE